MSHQVEGAKLAYRARLAEQAELFDEMSAIVEELVHCKKVLTQSELRLLAIAFKNHIAPARRGHRIASAAAERYHAKKDAARLESSQKYVAQMAGEIESICDRVDGLVSILNPATTDVESRALLAKITADYARYRAELTSALASKARAAYEAAVAAAETLDAGSAVRLGTALNYAVFTEEILGDTSAACRLAMAALQDAERSGGAEKTREGTLVERLLRDNLDLWSGESTGPVGSLAV